MTTIAKEGDNINWKAGVNCLSCNSSLVISAEDIKILDGYALPYYFECPMCQHWNRIAESEEWVDAHKGRLVKLDLPPHVKRIAYERHNATKKLKREKEEVEPTWKICVNYLYKIIAILLITIAVAVWLIKLSPS